MGRFVIASYRPREGCEQQLHEIVREHLPVLRVEGLVTDREPYVMQARDGTVVEVFEWKSAQAIEEAHHNETVRKMWDRFNEVCDCVRLRDLAESDDLLAGFEPLNLDHPADTSNT